jgi:hypothetical protein
MERAETLQHEAAKPQHPQLANEPRPATPDPLEDGLAHIPAATRDWLRNHPEYLRDPERNAALQHHHWTAKRETGEEHTPRYLERLEFHLGMRQQPQAPRNAAPAPRQQYKGPPMSAPPHRDPPSYTTGRPTSFRAPLTQAEKDMAVASGISEQEYAKQKEKMMRLQAAGAIQ